jgi:hypothetical protein
MSDLVLLTADDETDLRWYLVEARGDCGLRSTMGGQIACLEANAGVDRRIPELGQSVMYVRKESGGRVNTAEDMMARIVDSGKPERASKVAARLRAIAPCHVATLTAQYSMVTEIPGTSVSPLLASIQPLARETYRELTIRKTHRKKRAKDSYTETPLLWISNLIAVAVERPSSDEARILGTIIAQARTALCEACEAYDGT